MANHFSDERAVFVTPGHKLGECLWDGIATQDIRRRTEEFGIRSHEEYDEIIGDTNPIRNLDNLPGNVEVHLAMHDFNIPTRHGEKLISALTSKRNDAKIYRYRGKGHFTTVLKFALDRMC